MLEEKLFIDEMGSYSSPHTPIAPRTNNLVLACQAINGTVLNPGDVFSFNDTVGERTYERGYQNAAIYLNGETTDSVGGGICQVASTIYVCALRADLEIVQRTEHMYFVDYVPEGQDATIYWDGNLDFQFRNSTDYPMRIDASVSGGYVHIALWGTNEDGHYAVVTSETLSTTPWQVVINEDQTLPPDYQQVSITPYTGRVVRTYRNVYDRDGNLLSTAFEAESTYHKRDQVITVGKQPEDPVSPPRNRCRMTFSRLTRKPQHPRRFSRSTRSSRPFPAIFRPRTPRPARSRRLRGRPRALRFLNFLRRLFPR